MLCLLVLSLAAADRPNVLLAISDDQSAPHASAYGVVPAAALSTPGFDRVASTGRLFTRCYSSSPGCSPSRAALLTGRHCWSLREAGTHASSFPADLATYPAAFRSDGYAVGYTGKGWGPGNYKVSGRTLNPAGKAWNKRRRAERANESISPVDYAGNFVDFLDSRDEEQPFCFWYGGHEPHRTFESGSGVAAGKKLEDAVVPAFLPDTPVVRSDLLDYYLEIEHFDSHLVQMLDELERRGELENTLVIVTSDNGMSFPRAKANCYHMGINVPLAIAWPARWPPGEASDVAISQIGLTAMLTEAAGVELPGQHSLSPIDPADGSVLPGSDDRRPVCASRERHSSSRHDNLGYPQRAIVDGNCLLVENVRPDRWPAGDPTKFEGDTLGPPHGGYHDIDACPTLTEMIERRNEFPTLLLASVGKRPRFECFDTAADPACLTPLDPESDRVSGLREFLRVVQRSTGDLRVTGLPLTSETSLSPDEWIESYPRYSHIRRFPPPPDELPE